jgi:hypothetical protein
MIKNRGISSFDLGTYWRSGYLTQTEIQPVNLPVKNPYQRGGMRYIRYEIYKLATNIDEVKSMGATPEDMNDLRVKGLLPQF